MSRRPRRERLPRRDRTPYGSWLLGPAGQSARQTRIRVQLLLTLMLVTTNVVGAVLVFLISFVVMPAPSANAAVIVSTAIAAPVYLAVAVLVGGTIGSVGTLRALAWATRDDTRPTPAERVRVFKVPFRLTMVQFVPWVGATVLFTMLAVWLQPDRAITTGLTVGTAAVVVSGIAYLLTEFAMRPITARALTEVRSTDRPRAGGIRSRMVATWMVGTGVPVLTLVVAGILALAGVTQLVRLAVAVIVVGVVVFVFGLWMTMLGARAVQAPVQAVHRGMRDIEEGRLDTQVVVYDGSELGLLQAGYNQMVEGLRDRERISELFGRHVGRQVAQMAADDRAEIELGGTTRRVTVLFVDLTGSTSYAEHRSPAEVVDMLNDFFGIVVAEVDAEGGLVNKFLGDAVLAIFGAPVPLEDHAGAALRAARRIADRLTEEVTEVGFGLGVATGDVVVGHVGHEERFEYTAIGDAVNSAARLTDLAKQAPGCVLTTAETVAAAGAEDSWEPHDEVVLRGRSEPTATCVRR